MAQYAVRDRQGRWYAVDDRGDVVWLTGTHSSMRDELSRADAERVVASYAPSTRRSRGLRVVQVDAR